MARKLLLTSHVSLLLTSVQIVNTHLHRSLGCKYYTETSKVAHEIFQKGVCLQLGFFLFHNSQFFALKAMVEDWVGLQLRMHLHLGILCYYGAMMIHECCRAVLLSKDFYLYQTVTLFCILG